MEYNIAKKHIHFVSSNRIIPAFLDRYRIPSFFRKLPT
jgi:hypothetical protein